jgi:hypothetical protein
MRLPELDQEAIKAQPLLTNRLSDDWRSVTAAVDDGQEVWDTNRDLSKIAMFWCNGLECRDDPFGVPRIGVKRHICEFCRFREVDRNGPRPVCKQY